MVKFSFLIKKSKRIAIVDYIFIIQKQYYNMANISISIDEELVEWLDQLIERGVIRSRSEAIRNSLINYIKEQLNLSSREELREFLKKKQLKEFQSGTEAIRNTRSEE